MTRTAGAAGAKMTPMLRQYLDLKAQVGEAVLFYRLGDFYEMFFEDAELASGVLDLTLTARNKGDEVPIPLCGVPHHAADGYVRKLLDAGHRVAICEQMEDPGASKGLARREIVRVVSPGTVLEEEALDPSLPSYLFVVVGDAVEGYGAAALDVSTGELLRGSFPTGKGLQEALARMEPREILLGPDVDLDVGDAARRVSRGDPELFTRADSADIADRALAALRAVLEDWKIPRDHLRAPRAIEEEAVLRIDADSRRNLELVQTSRGERKGSVLWALDRTVTGMGARQLREWLLVPSADLREIGARHDAVEELLENQARLDDVRARLRGVGDLERLSSRVASRRASPRDLERLGRALRSVEETRRTIAACEGARLRDVSSRIDARLDLAATLESAIADEPPGATRAGRIIREGYSAEIDELREIQRDGRSWLARLETDERSTTGISSLKVRYNKVFGYYIEVTRPNLALVPDRYVRKQTLAQAERFVTPELENFEAKLLGAEERLRRLETRLFDELVEQAAQSAPAMLRSAAALGELDAFASLATVAAEGGWVRPGMSADRSIDVREGRHPVVERMLPRGGFVPNDVALDPDERQVIVVTGPNMAGKSTWLRQTALIVLIAQMGGFVPAREARIGIVDGIFTRVGASDNLATGDSTFMVEMKETAAILEGLSERSLVILDEIGRGTSTFDGISIAWAVAEYLHEAPERPRTLFATHFHELVALADSLPRVRNASVAVKEWRDEVVFLHRIVAGPASQSYGIHVARLAGVPEKVVARSREILRRLESGEHAAVGGPSPQLSLFDASGRDRPPPAPTADAKLRKSLRAIDPLSLTPIEALSTLAALVEAAQAEDE